MPPFFDLAFIIGVTGRLMRKIWKFGGGTTVVLATGSVVIAGDIPFNFDFMAGTGSYVAGLQGGYNRVFKSHVMLGFEADFSFPNSDVLIPFSVRGSQTIT